MDIYSGLLLTSGIGLLFSLGFLILLIRQLPHRIDPILAFSSALLFYASSGIFVQVREFGRFAEFGTRVGPVLPEHILEGYLLIALFVGIIVGLRIAFPHFFTIRTDDFKGAFSRLLDNDLAYLATIFGLAAFIVYSVVTGQFGYMGALAQQEATTFEDYGRLGVIGFFTGPIVFFLSYLSGAKFARPISPWLGIIAFSMALIPLSFFGRRNMVIGLFLVLVGIIMSRPRKAWKVSDFVAGGVLSFLAAFGFIFFYAFRREVNEDKAPTVEAFTDAWTATVNPSANPNDELYEQTEENVKGRLLGPVTLMAEMAREPDSLPGAQGRVLAYSVGSAIPRAIWRGKGRFVAENPSEELIALDQFPGVSPLDQSNTVVSSGYADFREAGVVLYAGLYAALIAAAIAIIRYSPTPFLKMFLFALLLSTVLSVEQSLNAYVLMFRTFVIVLVIEFVVLSYLNLKRPEPRLRQASYTN